MVQHSPNRAVQQRPINRYSVVSFSIRSADSLTDYLGVVSFTGYPVSVKNFDYSILWLKFKQSGCFYVNNQSNGYLGCNFTAAEQTVFLHCFCKVFAHKKLCLRNAVCLTSPIMESI